MSNEYEELKKIFNEFESRNDEIKQAQINLSMQLGAVEAGKYLLSQKCDVENYLSFISNLSALNNAAILYLTALHNTSIECSDLKQVFMKGIEKLVKFLKDAESDLSNKK